MFDPYGEWLGISKDRRPISCYQLLDIDPGEQDPDVIRDAAEARAVVVSAYRDGPHARVVERLLKEIEVARTTLLDPAKREQYDTRFGRRPVEERNEAVMEKPRRAPPPARNEKKRAGSDRPVRKGRPNQGQPLPWLWIGIGGGVALLLFAAAGVLAIVLLLSPKKTETPRSAQPVAQAPEPTPESTQEKSPPARVEPKKESPPPAPAPPKPSPPPPPTPAVKPPEPKPAAPKVVKLPAPDNAALARAEKAHKELYQADYARHSPEDQLALCTRFLQPGRENRNDPAAWFVLLREARDLAVQTERPRLAMEAINELNKWFLIDAPAMKVKVLATIAQSESPPVARLVMRTALSQVSQALDEDAGESALGLIGIAESEAAKLKAGPDEMRTIANRKEEVEAFRKEWPPIAAALAKLKQAPDDPAANLAVGKHLCYFHGRWDEGLPMLVKGSDAVLRGIAQKDLAGPPDPKVQKELGDSWWLIGRQEKGRRETYLQARALHWYDHCKPKLAGADLDQVAARVKEVEEHEAARIPRLVPGSFYGRGTEDRILLLREAGGTMRSEEAVEAGLHWLAQHQYPSGMWATHTFHLAGRCNCTEPGDKHNIAGTAVALLPFLGRNETHKSGHHRDTVRKGLYWLLGKQDKKDGHFDTNMYEHAMATIAVCEAYGLTKDPNLALPAQGALNYIMKAQNKFGCWGYTSGAEPGDTSVTGWQFTALKAGVYAHLLVPAEVFNRVGAYLDTVADPGGLGYGYNARGADRKTSAVGLLCREFLGWRPRHPDLDKGVNQLLRPENFGTRDHPGIYFLFYATQVMHHFGGKPWQEWNPKVRDLLVDLQDQGTTPDHPHQKGSWPAPDQDEFHKEGGRLLFTTLAILTLEQYYYSVPLNDYGPAVLQE